VNAAHVHLILNHVPILGAVFGVLVLLVGILGKRRAWLQVSWFIFIVAALSAIPTYLSGQSAEKIVGELSGVSDEFMEPHEEIAFYALIALETLGALSLLFLVLTRKREAAPWMIYVTLVVSLFTAALAGYTANLGGQIHHPEARRGFVPPPVE
jgi:uncharacterized membrane protein